MKEKKRQTASKAGSKEHIYTCHACGNTKNFKLYFSGTMEALCDCSGGSIVTISEEFDHGGSIDKVVCAECGHEV